MDAALPAALAKIRDETGASPAEAVELLLELLQNAPSSRDGVSNDPVFVSLLEALGTCRIPTPELREAARRQALRFLDRDRAMPSCQASAAWNQPRGGKGGPFADAFFFAWFPLHSLGFRG